MARAAGREVSTHNANRLAPLIFPNLVLLAGIGVWDWGGSYPSRLIKGFRKELCFLHSFWNNIALASPFPSDTM